MLDDILAAFLALPSWQQAVIRAVLIVVFGYLFMKIGIRWLRRGMKKNPHIDDTLTHFTHAVLSTAGWVIILGALLINFGVDLTAMLGGLAIGGFVIGFALKDTLGNLAAGVMLLFYRPFNIGDTVTIAGESGDIQSLGMNLTTIKAGDGKLAIIPNGKVLGNPIINHTREPKRRADVLVGIGYDDDIGAAMKSIIEELNKDERVLQDPAVSVRVTELGNSAVGLQVRPWVNTSDYWLAKAEFHAVVKHAVEKVGCSIPYPQTDVHVYNSTPSV